MRRLYFRHGDLPVLLIEEGGLLCGLRFVKEEGFDATPLLLKWKVEVQEYLAGIRRAFDLPYRLDASPFAQKVYEATLAIPYGETRTYAELLGPKYARAVGHALACNPLALVIPCHRVVGVSDPFLYRYGPDLKKRLLELEKRKR